MSWSYIPRWKFTDSCGRPRVPRGHPRWLHHNGHMLPARRSDTRLRSRFDLDMLRLSEPDDNF